MKVLFKNKIKFVVLRSDCLGVALGDFLFGKSLLIGGKTEDRRRFSFFLRLFFLLNNP